jgi:hypothetical protein
LALVDLAFPSIFHGGVVDSGNPPQRDGDHALVGQFHVHVIFIELHIVNISLFWKRIFINGVLNFVPFHLFFSSVYFTLEAMPFLQQVFQILFNNH